VNNCEMLNQNPVTCNYCTMNPVNIKLIATLLLLLFSVCVLLMVNWWLLFLWCVFTPIRDCVIYGTSAILMENNTFLWVCP